MGVEKGEKPSKILTMSGVPSSAEKRQNCDILQCLYIKTEWGGIAAYHGFRALLPLKPAENREKEAEKVRKCVRNIGLLGHKPPYFRGKTSDVCP